MKSNALEITYETLTNSGRRQVNEDYLKAWVQGDRSYYVLCDGLGGHGDGDVASRFVTESIYDALYHQKKELEEGILYAQAQLLKKQRAEGKQDSMKTTVACLELGREMVRFAHVGIPAFIGFTKGDINGGAGITVCPRCWWKVVQSQKGRSGITPDRSRLLRVMGTEWNKPKYEVVEDIPLARGSSFLLCSDGFWELIEEKKMAKLLRKAGSPGVWLKNMEGAVRENGEGTNMDNYSAIAVFVR